MKRSTKFSLTIPSEAAKKAKTFEMKNFSPTYRALEMYDVEKIFVCKESLEARGMTADDLIIDCEVLEPAEVTDLMEGQDVIFNF